MRVKRGVPARAKHKKILNSAKGMQHYRTLQFSSCQAGSYQILRYSYRDRRNRKRDLRALWITRINNASRDLGISYSQLMAGLKRMVLQLTARFSLNLPSINKSL